jgi:hypothetical protein
MGTRNNLRNSFRRTPVAEGVMGAGHGVIGVLIVQKAEDFRNDSIAVGSDEACSASLDALGPFGRLLSLDWKLRRVGSG